MAAPLLVRAARSRAGRAHARSGSCARPAARSRSTARSASATPSSRSPATPELCAEVTLQPVRRHGVDAAVLFADIMTPVLGMGIDVDLVEGVGPVVERPVRTRRRRRAAARSPTPRRRSARCSRPCGSSAPSSTPSRAVIGFCGGPVHRRRLPRRGPAEPRAAPDEGADALASPETWDALMAKLSETFAAYVAAKVRAGADVDPALRLLGRDAVARLGTASASAPWSARDPRRRRRPDDPLRHRRLAPARPSSPPQAAT